MCDLDKVIVLVRVSIAVVKHNDKAMWEERVISFNFHRMVDHRQQ